MRILACAIVNLAGNSIANRDNDRFTTSYSPIVDSGRCAERRTERKQFAHSGRTSLEKQYTLRELPAISWKEKPHRRVSKTPISWRYCNRSQQFQQNSGYTHESSNSEAGSYVDLLKGLEAATLWKSFSRWKGQC